MTSPRIVHDAKEWAGQFYERNRSEIFRLTWPNEREYVDRAWPHFVEGVRQVYAELLGRPSVSEADKEGMYDALIEDAHLTASDGAHSPLPIFKDTEAFWGDKGENRRNVDTFGRQARSLAAKFRTTSALTLVQKR